MPPHRFNLQVFAIIAALSSLLVGARSNADKPQKLHCRIDVEVASGYMRLYAIAVTEGRQSGRFVFKVRSRTRGGGSNLTQSGGFSVDDPNANETVLSTMRITLGGYDASLVVEALDKKVSCAVYGDFPTEA